MSAWGTWHGFRDELQPPLPPSGSARHQAPRRGSSCAGPTRVARIAESTLIPRASHSPTLLHHACSDVMVFLSMAAIMARGLQQEPHWRAAPLRDFLAHHACMLQVRGVAVGRGRGVGQGLGRCPTAMLSRGQKALPMLAHTDMCLCATFSLCSLTRTCARPCHCQVPSHSTHLCPLASFYLARSLTCTHDRALHDNPAPLRGLTQTRPQSVPSPPPLPTSDADRQRCGPTGLAAAAARALGGAGAAPAGREVHG